MRYETRMLQYARELEVARKRFRKDANLSVGRLARELKVSRYVAEMILREVSTRTLADPLDQVRNVLAGSNACDWKSLVKASGVSARQLRDLLNHLPEDDLALRAFRARRRKARLESLKEREKELATRLEEHLQQGGSFQSFAQKAHLSNSKVSGLFYRNLTHLDYARSKLMNPFGERIDRLDPENLSMAELVDARMRQARIEALKAREKALASRLEEHIQQGGSFTSFAQREGISRRRASGIFHRNLEHLDYGGAQLPHALRRRKIQAVCRLAKEGLKAGEIAQRLGIERDAVFSILNRYLEAGWLIERSPRVSVIAQRAEEKRIRKRKELLELTGRARELLKQGLPLTQVAMRLKVSYYSLYFKLRSAEKITPDDVPESFSGEKKRAKAAGTG
jgi:AraC-like DNA-binding protein/plasmid maintenance system antidote protein VapI